MSIVHHLAAVTLVHAWIGLPAWSQSHSPAPCGTPGPVVAGADDLDRGGSDRAVAEAEASTDLEVAFEGFVFLPDGAPAEGAVVVTSAGGQGVVDAMGHYLLDARVPVEANSVEVTAIGPSGQNLAASATIPVSAGSGWVPVGPLSLALGASCSPAWLPTFGGLTNGFVRALAVYDDGNGPALYAGGTFTFARGVPANRVARWNGSRWSALGSGMNGNVSALTVYDDGSGPALFVGGLFTTAGGVAASRIARWNGVSWSPLGSGLNNNVIALTVHDDGGGPALYAGGAFTTAGGVAASRVARWDGATWSTLGSGMSATVRGLTVYDDGGGPALYAGGDFTTAGGVAASRIARWDGVSWSPLGTGMSAGVRDLTVYDDGGGPALYAGGDFTTAGGVAASRIARWDGVAWSPLGSGMDQSVLALTVYDGGGGPALYAGGNFTSAGGVSAFRIARWDGASWSNPGFSAGDSVETLTTYDDGGGPALYVGGSFTSSDSAKDYIVRWDGSSLSAVGTWMSATVTALGDYDDGGGLGLYISGGFSAVGGVAASRIVRWDGSSWAPLGSGLDFPARALATYDDGSGQALYAGGSFTTAGGVAANRIARWDGSSWTPLGSGMNDQGLISLAVYDAGSGPELYAAGIFTTAGGVAAKNIARWNGSSWAPLGSGLAGTGGGSGRALTIYDDGTGPALYAGGSFTSAGGVAAKNIARWDGSSWAPLGTGLTNSFGDGAALALAVFDDGGGPELYAGGEFSVAGGVSAVGIARWDGSSWSALEPIGMGGGVWDLTVHDDGNGPALYAGGWFTTAGGIAAKRVARWDGSSWSALGMGIEDSDVFVLASHDDGSGPALFAGGNFLHNNDSGDAYLAKWGCPDTSPPVLSCPPYVGVWDDPTDGRGEVVVFSVTATDDLDPSPAVLCFPASGSSFPPGATLVTCAATDLSGNQSLCQFQVVVGKARRR